MLSRYPILTRFLLFVILPFIAIFYLFFTHLHSSLPQTKGERLIDGIDAPVKLSRDQHGVVSIEAKTDKDAFFSLGYAHAQDRLWQLEVQKRTINGRLSEIFGRQSVNTDIWFHTLGLYESGVKSWDALSGPAQASLTAYAAGINAWLDSDPVLPVEFSLLGIKPEHWHVNDSLAYIKLFALDLSGNFRMEMARMLASQKLNEVQLGTVFDIYPPDAPTTVADYSPQQRQGMEQLLALQQSIETQLHIGGRFVGSNGWVVAPQHTQGGQAILANDPHLGLKIPSLWYAASLRGDKINVSGMSLVGLPLIVFGRNQKITWGGTSMMNDNQDLYLERVNPDDSSLYLADGQWVPFTVRKKTLKVRADFPAFLRKALKPVTIDIRSTRHGPVISDMYKVFEQPVSLQWTALDDGDTSYESFFRLNYADDWSQFKAALKYNVAPGLNMLYADRKGNIGYVGAGRIPIRNKGRGALPKPGWDEQYRWRGFVPPEQWPQSFNPAQGYIVSANNKVVSDDYPYFISQDWAPPARASRISQLLDEKIAESGSKLTNDDMAQIQGDTLSLQAITLLPLLSTLKTDDQDLQQVLDLLSNWDGDMNRDSQAATVYNVWMRDLRQSIFADELKNQWGSSAKSAIYNNIAAAVSARNVGQILASSSPWCDDVTTIEIENCQDMLRRSLTSAMAQLSKLQGADPDDWQWGEVHHTSYDHHPFSDIKVLDTIFQRRVANGGSGNTVNVASSSFDKSVGYVQRFGAGFRQIVGLSDDQTSHLMMNSTGQSGNVLSEHYDDMVVPFRDLEFISMENNKHHSQVTLIPSHLANEEISR
jgi:penicillin amidase